MATFDTSFAVKANRRFIKKSMTADLLEAEHEQKLARAWRDKGDQKALHELTSAYFRLVVAVAARFKNYGLPMGDLIQEGAAGLMQAAQRFVPGDEHRLGFGKGELQPILDEQDPLQDAPTQNDAVELIRIPRVKPLQVAHSSTPRVGPAGLEPATKGL